jgi:hypothetical protein
MTIEKRLEWVKRKEAYKPQDQIVRKSKEIKKKKKKKNSEKRWRKKRGARLKE